jgi:hypothetical protein
MKLTSADYLAAWVRSGHVRVPCARRYRASNTRLPDERKRRGKPHVELGMGAVVRLR